MANDIIQIGNKIEIRAAAKNAQTVVQTEQEVYVSQFLQWADINVASIAIPTYKGHLVPLRVDDVYELQFYTVGKG